MKRMKKPLRIVIWVLLILAVALAGKLIFASPAFAPETKNALLNSTSDDHAATFDLTDLPPINDSGVTAKSYLVYDQDSGKILAARNPNASVAIASLTKLMTGYLVNRYGNFNEEITVQQKSEFNINPVLGLKAGDKVKISDLFNSMIVGSANDAALTLGYYLEDKQHTNVLKMMNAEAAELDMNNTHFSNALGFDSDTNYSTAADLKLLVTAIGKYTSFSNLDRLQSYSFTNSTGKKFSVTATNKLIAVDPEIHAVKTGFTDEAGEAMITSIQHNEANFIIIVLDGTNREADTRLLKSEIIKTFYTATTSQQ